MSFMFNRNYNETVHLVFVLPLICLMAELVFRLMADTVGVYAQSVTPGAYDL